jgi:hypothetical protein
MTVQAKLVLDLNEWAREHVQHESEEAAYDALLLDSQDLLGKEVYVHEVEDGEGGVWQFDPPVKAKVTRYEIRAEYLNYNDDREWFYIDPYVDVEILEGERKGPGYTFGRTHQWRKE